MKYKSYLLFVLFFYSAPLISIAQQHKIDSLLAVLKSEKEDTNKVKTLNRLTFSLYARNPDTTILLAQQSIALAQKLNWKNGEAEGYKNSGMAREVKGDYNRALDNYTKALKIDEEIGNKKGRAINLSEIGIIYEDKSDFSLALSFYQEALKLGQEMGDKQFQSVTLNYIGNICYDQSDYTKALDYYFNALKIDEGLGDKEEQASVLGNIGVIYDDEAEYPKALDYYFRALKLYEAIGNKQGQATNLSNIGIIYNEQGNHEKSLNFELKALKLGEDIGDKSLQVLSLSHIGNIYGEQANYSESIEYLQKALKIAQAIGYRSAVAVCLGNIGIYFINAGKFKDAEEKLKQAILMDSTMGEQNLLWQYEKQISRLYDTTAHYKLALEWYKKAMILKDTLFNIDKDKALTRKELTFKFERQADSAKSAQDKKDAVAASDKKKQDVITASVSVGLLLVLAFSVLLFNRFRITQRQKVLIEQQKNVVEKQKEEVEKKNVVIESQKRLVEEKNKDILDSITYAKRLQDAILPPVSLVQKYFPESFVLYKPKDIVADDFYWLERAGNTILLAACDCTGHGVPGALVSVVCSNALNRAVKEFHITEPGKILDKVRELVLETFDKSEGNIQDGMDISLLAISGVNAPSLSWSGAYNPLWVASNGKISELEGDKQPIGKSDNPKPFTTHTITLNPLPGGCGAVYLFTDGFADQFGGPKGKKFKYKQLQEKLLAISHRPLAEQKAELEKEFENWKGALEQTDDVCVIGIRI